MAAATTLSAERVEYQEDLSVVENIKTNRGNEERVVDAIEALGKSGSEKAVSELTEVIKPDAEPVKNGSSSTAARPPPR